LFFFSVQRNHQEKKSIAKKVCTIKKNPKNNKKNTKIFTNCQPNKTKQKKTISGGDFLTLAL